MCVHREAPMERSEVVGKERFIVPLTGFEPVTLSGRGPKPRAYSSSATGAIFKKLYQEGFCTQVFSLQASYLHIIINITKKYYAITFTVR
jgi:hypothetical protein